MKLLLASIGLGALLSASIVHAGAAKVELCHSTGSETHTYSIISIAEPAYDAHVAHGDFEPDEAGNCTQDEGPPGGES